RLVRLFTASSAARSGLALASRSAVVLASVMADRGTFLYSHTPDAGDAPTSRPSRVRRRVAVGHLGSPAPNGSAASRTSFLATVVLLGVGGVVTWGGWFLGGCVDGDLPPGDGVAERLQVRPAAGPTPGDHARRRGGRTVDEDVVGEGRRGHGRVGRVVAGLPPVDGDGDAGDDLRGAVGHVAFAVELVGADPDVVDGGVEGGGAHERHVGVP